MTGRYSRAWHVALRAMYALLALLDPVIRLWWRAFTPGNIVELVVTGRHTGQPRRVLIGLLRVEDRWYAGHPNGHVNWTRNLADASRAHIRLPGVAAVAVTAQALGPGPERDTAIRATDQHVFPGNVVYRLARRHVAAAGVYFRLDPLR